MYCIRYIIYMYFVLISVAMIRERVSYFIVIIHMSVQEDH